jgi:hypothetical protein
MHAKDHPKEMKFVRPGFVEEGVQEVTTSKKWADVLMGPALTRYMKQKMPSENVLARLRRMGRRQ